MSSAWLLCTKAEGCSEECSLLAGCHVLRCCCWIFANLCSASCGLRMSSISSLLEDTSVAGSSSHVFGPKKPLGPLDGSNAIFQPPFDVNAQDWESQDWDEREPTEQAARVVEEDEAWRSRFETSQRHQRDMKAFKRIHVPSTSKSSQTSERPLVFLRVHVKEVERSGEIILELVSGRANLSADVLTKS